MRQRFSPARLLASASLVAMVAVSLGGCTAMSKLSDVTGSIGPKAEAGLALDEAHTGFDEPAGRQQRLAPMGLTIALPGS